MYTVEDIDVYVQINGRFKDAHDILTMVNYFVENALERERDKFDAEGYVSE
jgi:hypothetical protein